MVSLKLLIAAAVLGVACANPSALNLVGEMYRGCLQQFSVSCVKPKALAWFNEVIDKPAIRVTDDLVLVKKHDPEQVVRTHQYSSFCQFIALFVFAGTARRSFGCLREI